MKRILLAICLLSACKNDVSVVATSDVAPKYDSIPVDSNASTAESRHKAAALLASKPAVVHSAPTVANKIQTNEAAVSADQGIQILKFNEKVQGRHYRSVYVRVKNTTRQLATYTGVTVTYYGSGGEIVGVGYGNAANIATGSERTIACLANDIHGAKTYQVEVSQAQYR